jgi:hypothetical protein
MNPHLSVLRLAQRALTLEEERVIAQRSRSEFIRSKKFCLPQFVQMIALQMYAKSGATDGREQTVVRPQEDLNAIVARR